MQANGKPGGGSAPIGGEQTTDSTPIDHHDDHVRLDDSAQVLIGQHLKAVYAEIVQQPIPDQLLTLLDELERKENDQ